MPLFFILAKQKRCSGGSDLLSPIRTIIGLGVFHFRVRDGNGWDNSGITATAAPFLRFCRVAIINC